MSMQLLRHSEAIENTVESCMRTFTMPCAHSQYHGTMILIIDLEIPTQLAA